MPAKFQCNAALTATQRDMLDAIEAGGRGPADTVVVKMLLSALEAYWNRFGVLPTPMRLVADVKSAGLHGAADDSAEFEENFSGVISLPNPGEPFEEARNPAVAESGQPSGKGGAKSFGPSVDELARSEKRRREKTGSEYPQAKRGGGAKGSTSGKTGRN